MQTYQGACHCGRITFEVRAELSYVVDCNCSICRGWAVNVRCIDGVDLSSLKVRPFDGQNWEATAKAYLDRTRSH